MGYHILIVDDEPALQNMVREILAQAGYGVALLPEILVRDNPFLGKVALRDTPLLSFGVYYKSLQGNEILKSFIRLLREETSARQREGSGAENS